MSADVVLFTDRSQLRLGRGLVRTVHECAAAGLRTVVVRELDLSLTARTALVARLREVAGLTVIGARTALPGAHGVHLGSSQPSPQTGGSAVGRSCHTLHEVGAAVAAGHAYLTLSPFAATSSKPGYGPPIDARIYRDAVDIAAGTGTRVLALGGVDATRARSALDLGVDGIAVMGAVMRATDPARAIAELLEVTR